MSETLCTLRTKGGGGGKLTETVLWTNNTPTSSMNAQNLTLSDNISNYKYIEVYFAYSTDNQADSYCGHIIMPVKDFKKKPYNDTTQAGIGLSIMAIGRTTFNSSFARGLFYINETTVKLTDNNTSSRNDVSIPLTIIGLK